MAIIPTSWDKVTVEQFQLLATTLGVTPTSETEALSLTMTRASILTGLEEDALEEYEVKELLKVNDLLKKPMPTKVSKYFRYNGQLYKLKLNPNLYSLAEYASVMNACKDDVGKNLHRIFFLVCKPITFFGRTKSIPVDKLNEVIESFKQLPISLVNPIVVFFCNLSRELTISSLEFSNREMEKTNQMLEKQIESLKDMDGL